MSEKPTLISWMFSKKGKLIKEKADLEKEIADLNLEKDVIAKRQERDKLRIEIETMNAIRRGNSEGREKPRKEIREKTILLNGDSRTQVSKRGRTVLLDSQRESDRESQEAEDETDDAIDDPQRKENPPARKAGEGAKARGKGREESPDAQDEAPESTEIGV